MNFLAAATAQANLGTPFTDQTLEGPGQEPQTFEDQPQEIEDEVQAEANNLTAEILDILSELDDQQDSLLRCEPVTVTTSVNETNPEDPVDWDIMIQPECLPS